ncbi:MAG: hypothetical protein V4739_15720 [Pseudomonadota bacterium]
MPAVCHATGLSPAAGARGAAWPEMPTVPKARVAWVAQEVRINGVPARIARFESDASVQEVLAHYQAHWSAAPAGPPRAGRLGEWQLVSTLHGPYHLVVQVKPQGGTGSEGLLSTVHMKELRSPEPPADWPRLDGVQIRQVMASTDGSQHSHHLLATSEQKLTRLRDRLMASLKHKGWRVQHEVHTPSGYLANCHRAGDTLDIALTQDTARPGLTLVANWVHTVGTAR